MIIFRLPVFRSFRKTTGTENRNEKLSGGISGDRKRLTCGFPVIFRRFSGAGKLQAWMVFRWHRKVMTVDRKVILSVTKASKSKLRACGRKQKHATELAAMNHKQHLRRKDGSTAVVYKCQDHWHVGHLPRVRRNR